VSPKDQEAFTTEFANTSLLKQISKQIKALGLQTPSTSCLDKTCVLADNKTSSSDSEEGDDVNESEDNLNVISKVFDKHSSLEINKIKYGNPPKTRNFYTRLTPPDLQFEERDTFFTNSFDVSLFMLGT